MALGGVTKGVPERILSKLSNALFSPHSKSEPVEYDAMSFAN